MKEGFKASSHGGVQGPRFAAADGGGCVSVRRSGAPASQASSHLRRHLDTFIASYNRSVAKI
jgi:hypothetical protein